MFIKTVKINMNSEIYVPYFTFDRYILNNFINNDF